MTQVTTTHNCLCNSTLLHLPIFSSRSVFFPLSCTAPQQRHLSLSLHTGTNANSTSQWHGFDHKATKKL